MKVILKENIAELGYKDDVVEVKDGYGRNYLIPQGKAIIASAAALRRQQLLLRALSSLSVLRQVLPALSSVLSTLFRSLRLLRSSVITLTARSSSSRIL